MSAIEVRKVGKSKAEVTKMGLGGAPLGDLFHVLDEDQAQGVLQAAWDAGIRYYDTAPFYGYGKSEHRVGHFLRQQRPDEYVLSTKVGRVLTAARPLCSCDRWDEGPSPARLVGVELHGSRAFGSVAEVQVCGGGGNVAVKGEARQTSTGFNGPAALAIDGNTDGDYSTAKSTTHTQEEQGPWWEVDLGSASRVDKVVDRKSVV